MRTTVDLNGTWDFVADLDPKYHERHGGFHNPGASRRHWLKVPVPGVWQRYGERYDLYEGVCWFAREFEVSGLGGAVAARLCFGGANYLACVYLNGERVGSHEGGYTGFRLDVTGRLRPGRNHLAVQVDNRASTIRWPPCLGYFNYGGIHRGVSLEILDGPVLDGVTLTAVPVPGGWELVVSGQLLNAGSGGVVRVCSGGGVCWERGVEGGPFSLCVPFAGVASWSPDAPHLEAIAVDLLDRAGRSLDRQELAFGFRALGMRDGQVQLNGSPYPLKGVCYVYDSPGHGLVMAPEQIETDLRLMKEAGCNAVRCHYPMDQGFYAACDRLGLLVWIEPPVYCYHPGDQENGTRFADPVWLALAQQMAREMVAGARNHPSVAIYSIGNECNTRNPEAEGFFRALAATVRSEDSTRLLSYAALYGIVGPVAGMVDVLGINSYYGWYDQIRQDGSGAARGPGSGSPGVADDAVPRRAIDLGPMRVMLDKVLAGNPGLALFLTEFGADSVPGYRSRSRDLWSEDYHADLLREVLELARGYPQIVGTFPFCFSDYRDPSKVHNGYWNELNLKGLVDYRRRKKLAFDAVRAAYLGSGPAAAVGGPAGGGCP